MTQEGDEVEDVVIDFAANFDFDTVLGKELQLLGLDAKEPVLRIGSKFYRIEINDSIGTLLLLRNQPDKDGNLEYYTKPDKEIKAHRVILKVVYRND